MKKYTHVIIGFGKGGKTLASTLAAKGESVALVEKSAEMYGETCINVACIPSKYLEGKARTSETVEAEKFYINTGARAFILCRIP